jgi:hypothetical protein
MRPLPALVVYILLLGSVMRFKYGIRLSDLRNSDTQLALVIFSVGGALAGVCPYRIDQLRGVPAAAGYPNG